MSAAHIAPQGGGFEPQRKFNYEFVVYGIPGSELLKLCIQSMTPSSHDNEVIEVPHLNSIIKVAGQGKWSAPDVVVRDMVDENTYESLRAWKKLVQDPATDYIGRASSYKKQGELILMAPDNTGERRFKMIGLWPSSLKLDTLDHTAGGQLLTIMMTLSCDKML